MLNSEIISSGIVLRSFIPSKFKVSILDYRLGKIEVVPVYSNKFSPQAYFNFSPGMHIKYRLIISTNGPSGIGDFSIEAIPAYWSRYNLLFFHRVLMLCYYFSPLEQESTELFNMIKELYTNPMEFTKIISQKIFICKIFKVLGIFPSHILDEDKKLYYLIFNIIDSNVELEETEEIFSMLDYWIDNCIQAHPRAEQLSKKYYKLPY